jgi:hypothetical protein
MTLDYRSRRMPDKLIRQIKQFAEELGRKADPSPTKVGS